MALLSFLSLQGGAPRLCGVAGLQDGLPGGVSKGEKACQVRVMPDFLVYGDAESGVHLVRTLKSPITANFRVENSYFKNKDPCNL